MKPLALLANGDPVATASGSDTASRTPSFDFLCKALPRSLEDPNFDRLKDLGLWTLDFGLSPSGCGGVRVGS
jgi:hypothetical protein